MRVLLLCVFLEAVFVEPRTPQRIVGGEATTVQRYPYMTNLQYQYLNTWYQNCGGSLLTSQSVLTAGHCFYGSFPSSWRAVVGASLTTGTDGTAHSLSQVIIHPQYDSSTLDNDVTILRLTTAVTFSDSVGVARISGPMYDLPDGTFLSVIGFGILESGGASPTQLQHVEVEVISHSLCAERYAWLKAQPGYEDWPDVTRGMLCAGIPDEGGKDACQGDSGGPVAFEGDILVGVTSWGAGCADAYFPGVFARVSHYYDWIVANAST